MRQRGERLGDPRHIGQARRLAGPPGGQQRYRTLDAGTDRAKSVHQVAVEAEQAQDVTLTGIAQCLARQPSAPLPALVVHSPFLGGPLLGPASQALGLGALEGCGRGRKVARVAVPVRGVL